MDAAELEKNITDFEEKLDRLRSLYEQYFSGIEKLEPQVPRKDLERRIAMLRKEQIRNTAMRFKFNMLVQRYNTMGQHWARVLREIEQGTYKRDLARAAARFGVDEALTAVGKKRAGRLAAGLAAQVERQGRRKQGQAPKPEDEYESVDDADIESVDESADLRSDDFDDDAPTPPPQRSDDQEAPAQSYRAPPPGYPDPAHYAQPAAPPGYPSPAQYSSYPPPQGYPQPSHQTYAQQAYPPQGYPQQAYPQQGYPQQGYPQQVPPHQSHAQSPYSQQQSYPQQSYPQQAYPQQGYPQQGYPQQHGNAEAPRPASSYPGAHPSGLPVVGDAPPREITGSRAGLGGDGKPKGGLRLGGGPSKRASAEALNRIASSLGDGAPPAELDRKPAATQPRRPLLSSPLGIDLPPGEAPDVTPKAPEARPAPAPPPAAAAPLGLKPPGRESKPEAAGLGLRPPPSGRASNPEPSPQAGPVSSRPVAPISTRPAQPAASPAAAAPERAQAKQAAAQANAVKPAARPSKSGEDSLGDGRLREIYSQYVQARRDRNESTANITFEKLADSLRSQADKLRTKHTAKRVDFEVVVKDGKALIKPIVR